MGPLQCLREHFPELSANISAHPFLKRLGNTCGEQIRSMTLYRRSRRESTNAGVQQITKSLKAATQEPSWNWRGAHAIGAAKTRRGPLFLEGTEKNPKYFLLRVL